MPMSNRVATFYDEFVDQQVRSGVNRRHLKIMHWLRSTGLEPDERVLEIGCGIGTVTSLLCEAVPQGSILANDLSPKSVETARQRLSHHKHVSFVAGDALELPINGPFDLVLLPDVLEHIPVDLHAALLLKLSKLLATDGRIVIHIPSAQYLEWLHVHEPGSLQIIDQPLHLDILLPKAAAAGLYAHTVQHYGLWTKDPDAALIILRPYRNELPFKIADPEVGWLGRLRRKLHQLRSGRS
jgi:cyclopropane fatty-acyl-phospholipid synthase-like methyltransferase